MLNIPTDLQQADIVLLDDITSNLRLLEGGLQHAGMRNVRAFTDSAQGLAWLSGNPWDLLLLDLDMPDPDGFEILRRLRATLPRGLPIIVISALADVGSRRRALELGASDFLIKPIDLPELLLRVRNNLGLWFGSQALQAERNQLEQRVERRTRQIRETGESLLRCLVRASEYKDNETGYHMIRVSESSALLARACGLAPEQVEQIRQAATMHDIGKVGIPERVLLKPGHFEADELELMRSHAELGYQILNDQSDNQLLALAAQIARHHHEKWDGSGYPQGLAGEQIPLPARIVALCDVYDALRARRPYKDGWTAQQTQEFIRAQAGEHFDPALVECAIPLFDQFEALCRDWQD